ncbi:MAG: SDR family oxidoreductase [Candidatus Micrarchaeota archaeon]|nr:SDR family oxidoreductase [Candidatus Micrarchaeota archaeon]
MNLRGKTVVITGASKGLGKTMALKFATEGCNLILNARSEKELQEVADECMKNGAKCTIVSGDITAVKTRNDLFDAAKEGLDILVNNAGMIIIKPVEENTEDEMRKIFELNVFSHILLTQKMLPLLKNAGVAQIINIISNSGLSGRKNFSLYCATKFAMKGYTDSIRHELNGYNIRTMGIYPGGIKTSLFVRFKNYDIGGFMESEDIAHIIVEACKLDRSASVDDILINRTNKN